MKNLVDLLVSQSPTEWTTDDGEIRITFPIAEWSDALAAYLRSVGIAARPLPPSSKSPLPGCSRGHDSAFLLLDQRTTPFLALRPGGVIVGRAEWTTSILGTEIAKRQLYPVKLHFIVPRNPRPDPSAYDARLRIVKAGFFQRVVQDFGWEGQWLARRLHHDRAIRAALSGAVQTLTGLRTVADLDGCCVRIVYQTRLDLGYSVMRGRTVLLDGGFPDRSLLDTIEAIARIIADG